MEDHGSCLYDSVKLFNGPTTQSPLINTYCGTNKPTQFQSGSNSITLLFQSDYSVTKGGWRVEWAVHTTGDFTCNNTVYVIYITT